MIEVSLFDKSFAHHKDNLNSSLFFKSTKIKFDRDNEHEIAVGTQYSYNELIKSKSKYRVLWFTEPLCMCNKIFSFLENNYINHSNYSQSLINPFSVVLLPWMELSCNYTYYPYGDSWIKTEDHKIYSKTKNISMVCSDKLECQRHSVRHQIASEFSKHFDGFGRKFNKHIDYKLDSLKDYKYQVVVENDDSPGFFTEKLMDCFLTGTIPIYFGTSPEYLPFDKNGIIWLENASRYEISYMLSKLNFSSSSYESPKVKQAIINNFNIAQNYLCKEDIIYKHLEKLGAE